MSETFGTTQKIKNIHADVDLLTSTISSVSIDIDTVSSGIVMMVPDIEEIRIDIDLLTSTVIPNIGLDIDLLTSTVVSGVNAKIRVNNLDVSLSNPVPTYGNSSRPFDSDTRTTDTTAYAAGDVVGNALAAPYIFENILSVYGGGFIIVNVSLEIDVAAVSSGMTNLRLHLYNDVSSTTLVDNAVFNLPSGDRSKYLGNITLNAPVDLGDTLWSQTDNVNFMSKLSTSSLNIYGILETLSAYTPTASTVKTITLNVMGV